MSARKLRVEVRQRLIHQAHRRLGDDGAAQRHALLLPAGQLPGLAFQQRTDAEDFHRALQTARALRRRHAPCLQSEHDVLGHRQMREQRIGLEHHGDAARGGRQARNVAAADFDAALARGLQSGDDAQAGGLAAAGRPEQHGEAARSHVQRDAVQRGRASPMPADGCQSHFGSRQDGFGRIVTGHLPVRYCSVAQSAQQVAWSASGGGRDDGALAGRAAARCGVCVKPASTPRLTQGGDQ